MNASVFSTSVYLSDGYFRNFESTAILVLQQKRRRKNDDFDCVPRNISDVIFCCKLG